MSEETILIADSDQAFTEPFAAYLLENGLRPLVIPNMARALETLMRESFDVAVIDFCDPSCREYVAAAVQRRVNGTAVIFTCARYSGNTERTARGLSPAFFFVKPVEPGDLLAVILRIVELRNKQKILAEQRMEKREGVRHEQSV